jgi:hypothetical protein
MSRMNLKIIAIAFSALLLIASTGVIVRPVSSVGNGTELSRLGPGDVRPS